MSSKERYESELAGLAGHVHGRNGQLVRIALLGLSAGRDKSAIFDDIIAAGGEPRLSDKEVTRAIEKAQRRFTPSSSGQPFSTHKGILLPFPKKPTAPNEREKGFVRELIKAGQGATSGDLKAISAPAEGKTPPWERFLRTIFQPGELVFAGTPQLPRTRENLKTVEELIETLSKPGATLPTHIVPNPFTGEAGRNDKGKVSYCLDSTVARRRMALIEFDELPLKDQAAFWMGAIRTGLLPVRSLVYSGGKSIHGLIELKDDGTVATWTTQWQTLERLLCSDDAPAYHADRACRNVSRLTRFPEASRPESHKRQSLIFLVCR